MVEARACERRRGDEVVLGIGKHDGNSRPQRRNRFGHVGCLEARGAAVENDTRDFQFADDANCQLGAYGYQRIAVAGFEDRAALDEPLLVVGDDQDELRVAGNHMVTILEAGTGIEITSVIRVVYDPGLESRREGPLGKARPKHHRSRAGRPRHDTLAEDRGRAKGAHRTAAAGLVVPRRDARLRGESQA